LPGQELSPDTVIHARYRIVRPIGRGGMGAVYEAIDQRLGHRVALKQTLVVGEAAERAFEREAHLLAGLRHAALPAVTDFFAEEVGRFLVMQYIPGNTLAELAEQRGGAFPVSDVLSWADQLLAALEYLHGRQPPILHRDIKPANLKLTTEGDVVLLDFGLAKGSGETTSRGPSVYGLTPQYAPLEQFQGTGTEPVSDLFALGGTLYFLMTGKQPLDAVTRASAVAMGRPDPLPDPGTLNPEVPPRVGGWLRRSLAIHKQDRHAGASAMRRELREIRTGVTATEPPTLPIEETGGPPIPPAASRPAAPRARGRRAGAWRRAGLVAAVIAVAAVALLLVRGTRRSGAEIRLVEGEGLELQWPASDLWTLYRGNEKIALHVGSWSGRVEPGRYRIVPSVAVFPPLELGVETRRKTVVRPAAGRFELQWAGPDLWTLYRGDQKLALHSGTHGRVLAPGAYRIVPADPVFEPVDFTLADRDDKRFRPPAGRFELQWRGQDLWTLYRGNHKLAVHSGTHGRVLAPGAYRIVPSQPVFQPIEFTLADGQELILKAK
jgi:hypothetical protein